MLTVSVPLWALITGVFVDACPEPTLTDPLILPVPLSLPPNTCTEPVPVPEPVVFVTASPPFGADAMTVPPVYRFALLSVSVPLPILVNEPPV